MRTPEQIRALSEVNLILALKNVNRAIDTTTDDEEWLKLSNARDALEAEQRRRKGGGQ